MRTFHSVGAVGAGLLAMSAVACGSTAQSSVPDSGGTERDSGEKGFDAKRSDRGVGGHDASGDAHRGAGGFIACEDPTPVVINGQSTGFVECGDSGVVHRASIETCSVVSPVDAGSCPVFDGRPDATANGCTTNSDCTARPYGTCELPSGHPISCVCSYGCSRDSDCSAGEICQCGTPTYVHERGRRRSRWSRPEIQAGRNSPRGGIRWDAHPVSPLEVPRGRERPGGHERESSRPELPRDCQPL